MLEIEKSVTFILVIFKMSMVFGWKFEALSTSEVNKPKQYSQTREKHILSSTSLCNNV